MKIGVYTDIHLSLSSSIIVGKSGSLSGRLENVINSMNWANKIFNDNNCDIIVNLGDTVDKSVLNAEEISALKLCNIDDHIVLLGNHERSSSDGKMNSMNMHKNLIINPEIRTYDDFSVLYLPYSNKLYDLNSLTKDSNKNRVLILSHNDIKNIMYGNYRTEHGYDLSDITNNSKLFVNGHIHNGSWIIKNKVMNLGLISGLNFSSTDSEWYPSIGIIDTDDFSIKLIENPEAYVFSKTSVSSVSEFIKFINKLPKDRSNIIRVKVPYDISDNIRSIIDSKDYISHSRVVTYSSTSSVNITNDNSELLEDIKLDNSSDFDKLRKYLSEKDSYPVSIDIINDEINKLDIKVS